jgi:two-component system sensor histidine kinase/response regulator
LNPCTTTAPVDLKQRKILIVDDDRLNIRILGGILRGEGYLLADADSGERALEVYATFAPTWCCST